MRGISVREICAMAREIILREMDPIEADGEEFDFPTGNRPGWWISPRVPAPNAKVDLLEAWKFAEKDAEACRRVLVCDGSIGAAIRVYVDSTLWMRFWSVRFPDGKWRTAFAQQLEAREEALAELRAKALENGNLKVVRELEGD
jgi:hypothetical protein